MAKLTTLSVIVNSLTKTEKRYFSLFTRLQHGPKDYLFLYELIQQEKSSEKIRSEFELNRPSSSIEATAKYLYKVITDCLVHIRMDNNGSAKLSSLLIKAGILFEKSMYEEGFRLLKRIQEDAAELGEYLIQFRATKLELYYLCNLNFQTITEAELIQKQMRNAELLKYAKTIQQHNSLYELLRHRLLHKGTVRTKQQKEELNDLVVSEMNLVSNPHSQIFESEKTHLLFQAYYFITINDFNSALKTFYELNTLFEKNNFLWIETPVDYLTMLEGILDSLHGIKQFKEMDFFLKKLQKLEAGSVYLEVMVNRLIFIYRTAGLIHTGEFRKAEQIKLEFEESLFKKIHYVDVSKQAEVYLYAALIALGCNDINRSHKYLNRILLESQLYYTLPVYRTFRLVHLLVHYELGNHDYIEYESRSFRRQINSSTSKSYRLEKLILKFLLQPKPSFSSGENLKRWVLFEKVFIEIAADKFECQLLKIFDFASWIEAKLSRKSFSELLKEKNAKIKI